MRADNPRRTCEFRRDSPPYLSLMPDFDWERPLADLRELAELTGGPDGARRLAWSEDWRTAREWLLGKLEPLGAEVERDAAGNLWATLAGVSDRIVVVGSHIDAVPHGGWLDGALGVCAALEVLRGHRGETPAVTIKFVDWADEEGARFGRSLLGSSAAAGTLTPDDVRRLEDSEGVALPDALSENGIDLDRMGEAELPDIGAYLELHIEQGPRLEQMGRPAAAVIGCYGVERHAVTFTGTASHAGSTPMSLRHDAFLAAGRFGLAARDGAIEHEGVATIGTVQADPGIPTIINRRCEVTLDQRAFTRAQLDAMLAGVKAAASGSPARRASRSAGVGSGRSTRSRSTRRSSSSPPRPSPRSPATRRRGCRSGALHDCAEVARGRPP